MTLEINSLQRAEKFIPDFIKTGIVYSVLHSNGELCSWPSNEFENTDVIPVWSNHFLPDARAFVEDAQLHEMNVDEFLALMTDMIKDDVMLGLNWDNQGDGEEAEPADVLKNITEKIEPEAAKRAEAFIPDLLALGAAFFENDPDHGLISWPRFEYIDPKTQTPIPVVPLWSTSFAKDGRKFATRAELEEIDLEELRSSFLPYAIKKSMLIGINWDEHGYGKVIDPKVLLTNLL